MKQLHSSEKDISDDFSSTKKNTVKPSPQISNSMGGLKNGASRLVKHYNEFLSKTNENEKSVTSPLQNSTAARNMINLETVLLLERKLCQLNDSFPKMKNLTEI